MKVDITITAVRRPELLSKTLESFKRLLFKDKVETQVILNVDPVGNAENSEIVFETALRYFPEVTWRNSPVSNFAKAFRWVWENTTSDLVFHLEDDWELIREVDFEELVGILNRHDDLASIRLPAFYSGAESMKNWNKFFPWNGEFYECPKDLVRAVGFCGHPSLIRGEFVRNTAKFLNVNSNPEKQFHYVNGDIVREVLKWRFGVFGKPLKPPYIRDIGRRWMVQNGFRKSGNKAFFMVWEGAKI